MPHEAHDQPSLVDLSNHFLRILVRLRRRILLVVDLECLQTEWLRERRSQVVTGVGEDRRLVVVSHVQDSVTPSSPRSLVVCDDFIDEGGGLPGCVHGDASHKNVEKIVIAGNRPERVVREGQASVDGLVGHGRYPILPAELGLLEYVLVVESRPAQQQQIDRPGCPRLEGVGDERPHRRGFQLPEREGIIHILDLDDGGRQPSRPSVVSQPIGRLTEDRVRHDQVGGAP